MNTNRRGFLKLIGAFGGAALLAQVPAIAALEIPEPAVSPKPKLPYASGYQKLPSGLILIWGTTDRNGRGIYPIVLNQAFNCQAVADDDFVIVKSFSTTEVITDKQSQYMVMGSTS